MSVLARSEASAFAEMPAALMEDLLSGVARQIGRNARYVDVSDKSTPRVMVWPLWNLRSVRFVYLVRMFMLSNDGLLGMWRPPRIVYLNAWSVHDTSVDWPSRDVGHTVRDIPIGQKGSSSSVRL